MSKLREGNRVIFNSEIPVLKKVKSEEFIFDGIKCVFVEGEHGEVNVDYLTKVGEFSDGYHTFNELYYHRMILFKVICHMHPDKAWKSWKHSDGTMFDGSFIVGITTPEGQYTYHYKEDNYDKFKVKELDFAPEYDGHQPKDITRLLSLLGE
ncbi:hypothetical protein PQE70_gp134 [Bacillus phage vB_BanS_Nate]|uniref:WDGH domain-containing protein n=1 Tax=Bacillus phage vB_BanS_Nate TaxID=2894788 RepID=A0AAE9CEI7_9CAUD|nr:hypothetical protein PQE70_gp134 [Bacillus phage vB_BanS_Nate]UGO50987.1 hypothetical protein NATE_134 [Bacillus phage vB_BanS_Nate]